MTGQSQFYPRQGVGDSALSAGLVATCDRALDTGTGAAPDWVHLLPLGAVEGRDGRSWSLDDPRGVVSAFNAGKIDLPVDYDHQNDKPDPGRPPTLLKWGRFRRRAGSRNSRSRPMAFGAAPI